VLSPTNVSESALTGSPSNIVEGAFVFVAADLVGNRFAIRTGVQRVQDTPGGTVYWKGFAQFRFRDSAGFLVDTQDPWTWEVGPEPFADLTDITGGPFFTGGTLSIRKDFDNDLITFTTPMGSSSYTLSQTGAAASYTNSPLNTTPIYPIGLGATAVFPEDPAVSPTNAQVTAEFFDFQTTRNGRIFFRHTLSVSDPAPLGIFTETAANDFNIPVSTLGAPHADTQLSSSYQVGYQVTTAAYGQHLYTEYRASPEQPPRSSDIDMELADEHGILFRAGPGFYQGNDMWFERSFDHGHTWGTVVIAATDPAWSNSSPSLNWVNSGLYLTWHNGTDIVTIKSVDAGANWDMPVTVPFTGTNPRRIAEKHGGPVLLFFINTGGDLVVAITYDNGSSYITGSPFLVAANVGAQQVDAEFAPDSSIVCSYTDTGIWTQKRSRDTGVNWS
jgi:hypothetical protein